MNYLFFGFYESELLEKGENRLVICRRGRWLVSSLRKEGVIAVVREIATDKDNLKGKQSNLS